MMQTEASPTVDFIACSSRIFTAARHVEAIYYHVAFHKSFVDSPLFHRAMKVLLYFLSEREIRPLYFMAAQFHTMRIARRHYIDASFSSMAWLTYRHDIISY